MNNKKIKYEFNIVPTKKNTTFYWQLEFTRNAHSVLEIGCSNGFLSNYLVKRGSYVVGVEIDPVAGKQAQLAGNRVIIGNIEDRDIQEEIKEKFDAVLLGDVLEHLKTPQDLLEKIRDFWLNSEGWAVISIPNSAHWVFRREVFLGHFPYRQYGLFDETHLRFFTRKSINKLFEASGFIIAEYRNLANFNEQEDITFKLLTVLHKNRIIHRVLNQFELLLVKILPDLFAYQMVFLIRPAKNKD